VRNASARRRELSSKDRELSSSLDRRGSHSPAKVHKSPIVLASPSGPASQKVPEVPLGAGLGSALGSLLPSVEGGDAPSFQTATTTTKRDPVIGEQRDIEKASSRSVGRLRPLLSWGGGPKALRDSPARGRPRAVSAGVSCMDQVQEALHRW